MTVPPCDEEGGIVDGRCQWGYPPLLPENIQAWVLWSDINLIGPEFAWGLRSIVLTDYERGDLLLKLRVLAAEAKKIERERLEEIRRKNSG